MSAHRQLCAWFEKNARDLPWRSRPSGYRVWVSEIMLQQTRAEAVREKYTAFMRRFPSLRALADARVEEVLQAWSGLGYYRRARMLHAAARRVVSRHGGRIPRNRDALLKLPGIGRYTAGAIASIAFNQAEPVVDGNVRRVFSRRLRMRSPKPARLWDLAQQWITRGAKLGLAPRTLNQALMELGAAVCTPHNPDCGGCPVRRGCAAFEAGDGGSYPAAAPAAPRREIRYLVLVMRDRRGRVLMRRRRGGEQASVLPAGLWELPHAPWADGEPAPQQQMRELIGGFLPFGEPAVLRHSIMNYDVSLAVQAATPGSVRARGCRWFAPGEAERAAISSATRKALLAGQSAFPRDHDAL